MNFPAAASDRETSSFDEFLRENMGIGPGVFLLDRSQDTPLEERPMPERQVLYIQFLSGKLLAADAFATADRSAAYYESQHRITPYTAPEDYKLVPSSATQFDLGTLKPVVYLHPSLAQGFFSPGEVLFAYLQAAFFWSYLQQSGSRHFPPEVAADITERLISFADTCGFTEAGVTVLRGHLSKLKAKIQPS